MNEQRRALLVAALGFLQLRQDPPEVAPLRRWLDSWRGAGDVIVGLNAQALDVEMRQFPAWLARQPLPDRHRALDRGRLRVGTDVLAGGAAGPVGGAGPGTGRVRQRRSGLSRLRQPRAGAGCFRVAPEVSIWPPGEAGPALIDHLASGRSASATIRALVILGPLASVRRRPDAPSSSPMCDGGAGSPRCSSESIPLGSGCRRRPRKTTNGGTKCIRASSGPLA
jgi:hypothetical protein